MNYTEAQQHWRDVIAFTHEHCCTWSTDPTADADNWGIHLNDLAPHNRLLGPVFPRGPVSGLIDIGGVEQCSWGEPDRADMTFSVTKTYLALVAGVAFDRGLMPDPSEPVCRRVPGIGFDDKHNAQVTWENLLQFTSEWSGVCFGIPDSIDHYRHAGLQPDPPSKNHKKGDPRPLGKPGTYWEYNDIRINQFSLALMYLFQKPLPEVFREAIMHPLEASNSWQWHGYENSWISLNNERMQSVPGGGHWGGGLQISPRDQALVARMMLNNGQWKGSQIISQEWLQRMRTSCDIAPFYGYFTWLNQGHKPIDAASAESFFGLGIGGQVVWHDPTQDLVAVFRWIDTAHLDGLIHRVNQVINAG